MIIIPPALVERPAVAYVAKPLRVTMETIDPSIAPTLDEVKQALAAIGVEPIGPALIRYRVIDMERELSVEIGWPIDGEFVVPEGLMADELPAGTYGLATYRNLDEGVAGNGALIDWAVDTGVEWDRRTTAGGDAFASRIEVFLTDPAENANPTEWDVEVAILIKDA